MVTVENAVLAKMKTQGANFEILVDCEKAIAFRGGANIDIRDVLAAQNVFSDSKKGLPASEIQMQQIFGTANPLEVAKEIIRKGEIQLTAEYRQKLREQKKKQIINFIHVNAIDPKTGFPHPATRIEAAIDQSKVKIDEYAPVEKQMDGVLKEIRIMLPIKFVMKEIAVKFPAEYAGKGNYAVQGFGKLIKQEWQSDGSWVAVVEIPGGLEEEFYDKINSVTHGNAETKRLAIK